MSARNHEPTPTVREIARIAFGAGRIILRHYGAEAVGQRRKGDESPVTDADEDAEAFILAELHKHFPDIPVIAEEEVSRGHVREIGRHFFLVDPLDGTKEFLSRNGEFTVNIGEIVDGRPVRGVVVAPAKDRLFLGEELSGAFQLGIAMDSAPDFARLLPIHARPAAPDGLVAVASRSHRDSGTEEYLSKHRIKEFIGAGSSLKFCLVAAGEADIYPRLGRTMEWDTAAGHAVLSAAGGSVTTLDGKTLMYGKTQEGFANPSFVARGAV